MGSLRGRPVNLHRLQAAIRLHPKTSQLLQLWACPLPCVQLQEGDEGGPCPNSRETAQGLRFLLFEIEEGGRGRDPGNYKPKAVRPSRVDGFRIPWTGYKRFSYFAVPTVEPVKYLEIKSGSAGQRSDNYSIVRASQVPSLLQLKDIVFPSSLSAVQYALKPPITSSRNDQQPQTPYQSNSRPVSPYSRRPSPSRSAAPVFSRGGVVDTLRKSNDILTQEVSKLHGQIKSLKQKSEVQDSEIRKLKETAETANALVAERSLSCSKAIRAVKAITDQLKEITDNLPPEISESESFKSMQAQVELFLDKIGSQAFKDNAALDDQQNNHSGTTELAIEVRDHRIEDNNIVNAIAQNIDGTPHETNEASVSNAQSTDQPSIETGFGNPRGGSVEGQKEVIEQFEPGVYVTVLQLANGTKIFRRVRFSKRRFYGHQAEEWWKENKD